MFRALAILEAIHEPVARAVERGSVLFAVRENDARKTA
jgi:hypothetical protein